MAGAAQLLTASSRQGAMPQKLSQDDVLRLFENNKRWV